MDQSKQIPARALIECILCAKCCQYATATGGGVCATCAIAAERDDLRAKLEALADTYAASATAAERRLREVVIAREAAEAENDKLRLLLAASKADCAYCGLPSDRMAECASGFPGCARADDMLMDGTPTRKELQHECARLRTALTQIMEYDTFENSRDPRTLMAKEALR